jgi:hypothetical protein
MSRFDTSHLRNDLFAGHAIQAGAVVLPDGKLIISGDKRALDLYAQQQVQAQHRKTWALALDSVCLEAFNIYGNTANCAKLRLPCPPIEATKDK